MGSTRVPVRSASDVHAGLNVTASRVTIKSAKDLAEDRMDIDLLKVPSPNIFEDEEPPPSDDNCASGSSAVASDAVSGSGSSVAAGKDKQRGSGHGGMTPRKN